MLKNLTQKGGEQNKSEANPGSPIRLIEQKLSNESINSNDENNNNNSNAEQANLSLCKSISEFDGSRGQLNQGSGIEVKIKNLKTGQPVKGLSEGIAKKIKENAYLVRNKKSEGKLISNESNVSKNEECHGSRFGFVQVESLYGNSRGEGGIFDSKKYGQSLKKHINEKNQYNQSIGDKKNCESQRRKINSSESSSRREIYMREISKKGMQFGVSFRRDRSECESQIQSRRVSSDMRKSVLDNMLVHIADKNKQQLEFIDENMKSIDAKAHMRYEKFKNSDQAILSKLNNHIHYIKDRDFFQRMGKASVVDKEEDENEGDLNIKGKSNDVQAKEISGFSKLRTVDVGDSAKKNKTQDESLMKEKVEIEESQISFAETQVKPLSFIDNLQKGNNFTSQESSERERALDKQRQNKNRKVVKNRIDSIISNHKKVIQEIDVAYSDVTEKCKEKEIVRKIKRLSLQHQYQVNQNLIQNKIDITQKGSIKSVSQIVANFQDMKQINSNISKIEQQKKQLCESLAQMKDETRLYFQPGFKQRHKDLVMDLSTGNNKEHVIDLVLMNYFHQQDLLKEKEQLLLEAIPPRLRKSDEPVKPYRIKELRYLLSTYEQQHLRMYLRDVQSAQQEKETSFSFGQGRQIAVNQSNFQQIPVNNQIDEQIMDVDIFKEEFSWKKRQNKIVNFSKVCEPAQKVLTFMRQDPSFKKQQNIDAIEFLIQFDPDKQMSKRDQTKDSTDSDLQFPLDNSERPEKLYHIEQDSIMCHCFFHFSNKNDAISSERFKEMDLDNFLNVFHTLSGSDSLPDFIRKQDASSKGIVLQSEQEQDEEEEEEDQTNTANLERKTRIPATFQDRDKLRGLLGRQSFFSRLIKEFLRKMQKERKEMEENKQKSDNSHSADSSGSGEAMYEVNPADGKKYILNKFVLGTQLTVGMLCGIFQKLTEKKKKKKRMINYYEFMQGMRLASVQYFLQSISECTFPSSQELFERFFTVVIHPHYLKFRDPIEIEIIEMRSHKYIDILLKFFESNLKDLYIFTASLRNKDSNDFSQMFIQFQEFFELFEKLSFFPTKISKIGIRYIYHYTLSINQRLDFKDFCLCFHLIALTIVRHPNYNFIKQNPQEIYNLQLKCKEIKYAIFKLKQDKLLDSKSIKFIQDISLFYVHKDLLDYQNLNSKIIQLKEALQKQQAF